MVANDPTWLHYYAMCLLFMCYASKLIKTAMARLLGEFAFRGNKHMFSIKKLRHFGL